MMVMMMMMMIRIDTKGSAPLPCYCSFGLEWIPCAGYIPPRVVFLRRVLAAPTVTEGEGCDFIYLYVTREREN